VYALPIVGNTQLLFYRSDVTRAAGFASPPKTVNEMIEVNKKVTDPNKPFYGCIIPAKANYDIVYTSLAYVKGAGGDIFVTESGPDWTIRFTSPESVKGFKAWLSLRPWSSPDSANVHWAELMNYILTDRAWGGLTVAAQVFQIDDPQFSKVPGKIDVTMPLMVDGGIGKPAPILGTWSMAIPLRAPNKAEALAFMKWALTAERQREYATQGGIAVRRDVLADPALTRDSKNRWFAAELESSALGQLRPQMEHWIEVQDRMMPYLQKAFTNEMPLAAALNGAAKEVKELLDRYGYKNGPYEPAKE
jgi:multiple sugar transport system substrate-binding protein